MNLRLSLMAASLSCVSLFAFANELDSHLLAPQASQGLLKQLVEQHGLQGAHGFATRSQQLLAQGQVITRLQHTYHDLPVFQSESVVLSNVAGELVSESLLDRRHTALLAKAGLKPAVSAQIAIDCMVRELAPNGTHVVPPTAELGLYPLLRTVRSADAANKAESQLNALDLEEQVVGYELAYRVSIRMSSGGQPVYYDAFVRASDGSMLTRWSAQHTVAGTGRTYFSGNVAVNTTLSGSQYRMLDPTRGTGGVFGGLAVVDFKNGTSGGTVYTNTSNIWGDNTLSNALTPVADGYLALSSTYDLLKNVLGRQGLDGKNTASYIGLHYSTNYANVFFDGTCNCIKAGDNGSGKPLLAPDVVAHELGHGLTIATANLTYSGESGGLNESSSDIMGEMVEAYARGGSKGALIPAGNNWLIGSQISNNGTPLRYMVKPSKDGRSPEVWSSTLKNLDVHYSSGPNNRMFYFLSQGSNATVGNDAYSPYLVKLPKAMTGIGNDHAYRIWYRALSTKFTSSTNYANARLGMIAAARELYGTGSKEDKAVQRAFAAINVGADVAE